MAIRDDLVMLLRQDLGAGFEAATLAQLMKAYTLKAYKPRLRALYYRRIDDSGVVAARQDAEQKLRDEEATRKALLAEADAKLEADLEAA